MNQPPKPFLLSPAQREQFETEGYLVIENLLDDAVLDPVIAEISEQVDQHAQRLYEEGKLSSLYEEYDFSHRLAMISSETDVIAKAIWGGTLNGEAIFNLIRNPRLLDMVEAFTGPELIASSVYRLRPKIPNYNFGAVPWHQDSGYFEPFCDKALVMTFWIPLVDANEENGCLWVLPRSHHSEVLPHRWRKEGYLVIDEKNLPADQQPVCCPVPKGGALLLHNRIPHVSYENKTDAVRWSMDLRYQSAASPTNAPISKLPGEQLPRGSSAAEPDYIPPACYPPEADFLVRSKLRSNEVVTDHQQFARIRDQHINRPVTDRWSHE
ncbi:MAG: phytanoyl-CoA dioxygenase family protein [Phycisphaeraceae bacterium]|nr:phytanoyl-CoA dioxygenase family protein [Phycisphaeraceae bacterium]